jgi:uncharacterized Zn-finger protein
MGSYVCEFCNRKFSSSNNLTTHKRTAKYCLAARDISSTNGKEYICEKCTKKFTSSTNLKRHAKICTNNTIHIEIVKNLLQDAYKTIVSQQKEIEALKKKKI